jgi:hypothetical protein
MKSNLPEPSYFTDANPHRDTTEAFSLLNRAYEVLMHPELRQRYDLYGRQGVGTSALSDSEKIVETINQQPKDWTQVLVEPYKTVVVVNQTNSHGDEQDVKWKKEPPPYEERLVPYRHPTVQLKQAVNEERSYGHVVHDYQSLANTNWETCMKNSMDETKYVRPKRSLTCLYRILGVPPQATAEQLQQAFAVVTEDYNPTMDLGMCDGWWLRYSIGSQGTKTHTMPLYFSFSRGKQSTNLCSLPSCEKGLRYIKNPGAA